MNKSRKFLSISFALVMFLVLQSGFQWAAAAEVLLERPYVHSKGDVLVLSNSRTYTLISQKGDFEVWEDNRGRPNIYSTNPLLPRIGWRYLKKDKYVNRYFELDEGEVWKLWPISAGSSAEIKVKFYKEEVTDYKGDPRGVSHQINCSVQGTEMLTHPIIGKIDTVVVSCEQWYKGSGKFYVQHTRVVYIDGNTGMKLREVKTWPDDYMTDVWTLAVLSRADSTRSNIRAVLSKYAAAQSN